MVIDVAGDVTVSVDGGYTIGGLLNAETVQAVLGNWLTVSGAVSNLGTLRAQEFGTLEFQSATLANAGHSIIADGGWVTLASSSVSGGSCRSQRATTSG